MKKQTKFLKVTTTRYYLLEMYGKQTEINGWTPKEVVEDWFGEKHINGSHATRDNHEIGGTIMLNNTEVVDKITMDGK